MRSSCKSSGGFDQTSRGGGRFQISIFLPPCISQITLSEIGYSEPTKT